MQHSPRLRTPAQARKWIDANGINVSEWCRQHGFNRHTVADLLRGKRKGHRGEAHKAAVALGMKQDPKEVQL